MCVGGGGGGGSALWEGGMFRFTLPLSAATMLLET